MNYNIEKLLQDKKLEYKMDGPDAKVKCFNPDHEDSSPSMRIDVQTGQFHCFSCGFKGHSILAFFNREGSATYSRITRTQGRINSMIYESRGVELPNSRMAWEGTYREISEAVMQKYKAFSHSQFGEGRVCFPIIGLNGKVQAVTARRLDSNVNPKYLIFPREAKLPIYPFHTTHTLVLVEGITDMLHLESNGLKVPVSTIFGAKTMTYTNVNEKLQAFEVGGLRRIVLLLDNDPAGNAASEYLQKVINLKTDIEVDIFNSYLPKGKDPGDLTREQISELNNALTQD